VSEFIHLHNHSHYSLQDGACTIDGLVNAAKKFNMKSVALTDHGVMYGIAEFYNKATKAGIKPIIGMEAYIVRKGSRFDRGKSNESNGRKKSKHYNHLILLAKNKIGYNNLSKLSTLGHTSGTGRGTDQTFSIFLQQFKINSWFVIETFSVPKC